MRLCHQSKTDTVDRHELPDRGAPDRREKSALPTAGSNLKAAEARSTELQQYMKPEPTASEQCWKREVLPASRPGG